MDETRNGNGSKVFWQVIGTLIITLIITGISMMPELFWQIVSILVIAGILGSAALYKIVVDPRFTKIEGKLEDIYRDMARLEKKVE